MDKQLQFSLLLLLAIAVLGCSPADRASDPLVEGDFIGTYGVRWEPYKGRFYGIETLTMQLDHTFQQLIVTNTKRKIKNTGNWALEQDGDTYMVSMDNVLQYMDEWHNKPAATTKRISILLPVYKHGSNVSIVIDDDMGFYYQRLNIPTGGTRKNGN